MNNDFRQEEFIKKWHVTKHIQPRKVEAYQVPIKNTGRVERILKLITFLNEWRNPRQIAEHLGVSYKSVHRYIALLAHLGFEVEHLLCVFCLYRVTNTAEYFTGTDSMKGKIGSIRMRSKMDRIEGNSTISYAQVREKKVVFRNMSLSVRT